jgi:hypothetical protein
MAIHSSAGTATHQIVRLKPGRHVSSEQGACVVELSSMLAGERFSDHPRSVCPVIACFMRTVNDAVGEERLQELYPYASEIVGTRGGWGLRRERARLCAAWCRSMGETSRLSGAMLGRSGGQRAAMLCARAALRCGGPSLAMALADALIHCASPSELGTMPAPGEGAYVSRRSSASTTALL